MTRDWTRPSVHGEERSVCDRETREQRAGENRGRKGEFPRQIYFLPVFFFFFFFEIRTALLNFQHLDRNIVLFVERNDETTREKVHSELFLQFLPALYPEE